MADRFTDPEFQANFEKALEPIKDAIGETQGLIQRARQDISKVEAEAKRQQATPSEVKPPPAAAPETSEAVAAETTARKELNQELERSVQLREAESRVIIPRTGGGRPYEQTIGGQLRAEEERRRAAAQAAAREDVPQLLASQEYMQQQQAAMRQAMFEVPQARGVKDPSQLAGGQVAAEEARQAAQAATQQAAANQAVLQSQTALLASTQGLSDAEQKLYERSQLQAGTVAKRAAAEREMSGALQQSILYSGQADDSIRRHGALTTEFIQAAARGQVTLQEFGTQIGQTVGKFAGWTAAAAAVYGTLGAVTELGKGAIDGATEVGQLHRTIENLDTRHASEEMVQLAQDTITPIKEAGDAMFQFSRTFHNVDDAAYTAGLALRAYKLDGVSVADQVKAMTAIHQQFGISAQGMGAVYDELAAGQRLFNARITEQIPLIARSASAVKNAGGDFQKFLELTTIALRTTGLSGAQLGTMFTRSAATFIHKPADQEVLRQFGLDPNEHYDVLLFHALERAATLNGAQRRQLSQAIFGPLLGARGAGLTGAGLGLLDQVRKELDPSRVKGSFMEEFAKYADTSQQKLNALKVDLQGFGAALGQSGVLAPLGALVTGLDDALKFSTRILQIWQGMPTIVKDVAGGAALLFGARAVTQRVGLTGVPFFGRTQAQTDRSTMEKGLADEQSFYENQYRQTARQGATANLAAQQALITRNQAVASGTMEEQIRAQRVYETALERAQVLENERLALEQTTLSLQERNNRITAAVAAGMTSQQALAAEGVAYQLGTLVEGRVVAGAVRPVGAAARPPIRGAAPPAGGQSPGGVVLPVGQTAREVEQESQQAQQTAAEQTRFSQAMGDAGRSVRTVAEGIPGATATIGAAATAFGAAKTATTGLIGKIGGFWGALTGFILIAGQVDSTAQGYHDAINAANQSLDSAAQSFSQARTNAITSQQKIQELRRKEDQGLLAGIPVLQDVASAASNLPGLHQLNQLAGTYSASDRMKQRADALKKFDNAGEDQLKKVESGWQDLVKTPQGRQDMYTRMRQAEAWMRGFVDDSKEGKQALQTYLGEVQRFYGRFQDAAVVSPIDPNDIFKQFRTQDLPTTSKQMQGLADRAKVYGVTPELTKQLTAGYQYVAQAYAGRTDSPSLQLIDNARQAAYGAVQQNVQNLIQLAQNAKTPRQTNAYIGQATGSVNGMKAAMRAGEEQMRKDVDAAMQHWLTVMQVNGAMSKAAIAAGQKWQNLVNQAKALSASDKALGQQLDQLLGTTKVDTDLQEIQSQTALRTSRIQGYSPGADVARKQSDLAGLQQQLAKARADGAKWQTISDLQTQINNASRDILQAQDSNAESLLQSQNALATSEIGGIGPEADLARQKSILSGLQGILALHQKQGRDQTTLNNDQTAINNQNLAIQQAAASNATSLAQAQGNYAKSLIRGVSSAAVIARLRADVGTARSVLAADQANAAGQAQILGDKAALNNALEALNEQMISDAEATKQSLYTLKESETQDPVKRARIEMQAAAQAVADAAKDYGKGSKEYNNAKADYNSKRQAYRDAILQGKEDDIQFNLDLGRISVQTAIEQYQSLLKMHNLTKAQRRQILEQIHQLQNAGQSDFGALNLGTIRLPTPYEIRAGLLAAQRGRNEVAPQTTNHFNVTVNSESGAHAFWAGADRHINGASKSIQRAQGVR